MKLVPGVKVDNQADGERVHLSIRGQGILTERGTRGIKTIVDGIPLNDPSGFVPDFFDIDWATVRRIEILRGPAAAFYGSGSSGGIINILTRDGGAAPISADAFLTGGSFGFYKGLAEVGGTTGPMNYRVAGSYTSSDGYREHTKFWADNFYGKFHFDVGALGQADRNPRLHRFLQPKRRGTQPRLVQRRREQIPEIGQSGRLYPCRIPEYPRLVSADVRRQPCPRQ